MQDRASRLQSAEKGTAKGNWCPQIHHYISERITQRQATSKLNSFAEARKSVVEGEKCSQWQELMRKFSDDCRANDSKQACYRKLENMRCEWRPLKTFWTGSTYLGTWNGFGMSGYGIYTYANGTVYEGEFEDNMFHGEGILKYPNGISVRGIWVKGILLKPTSTTVFADGLMFRENNWQYCEKQDRRFSIEYIHKLQPAGRTFLSADGLAREIPEGFYDCTDGFFDPKSNTVYDYNDLSKAIRVPDMRMRDWIMKNCRTSGQLKPLGPQPQLYEEWVKPIYDYVHPTPPPELFTEHDFVRTFINCSYQIRKN